MSNPHSSHNSRELLICRTVTIHHLHRLVSILRIKRRINKAYINNVIIEFSFNLWIRISNLDIDMRTIKTLGEYEEMKKRNGSMNMFKMKLERRLRQSKLEKRNLYIPFEDRRVDTTLLLEQTQDLLD